MYNLYANMKSIAEQKLAMRNLSSSPLPNTDFDMSIGNFTHTVYKYTNVIACNNERTEKFIIARKLSILMKKIGISGLSREGIGNVEV